MTEESASVEVNVRSDRYLIAHARGRCGRCGVENPLVGLVLPPGHETLALDCADVAVEAFDPVWEPAESSAFLFYVERLPISARHRLGAISGSFRHAFSEATLGCYWANHCTACGAVIDDHDLYCEPEGAFVPTSAAAAGSISLVAIDEPIEAGAAGYAVEPQFFEFMTRG
jgi:hypothetical protein